MRVSLGSFILRGSFILSAFAMALLVAMPYMANAEGYWDRYPISKERYERNKFDDEMPGEFKDRQQTKQACVYEEFDVVLPDLDRAVETGQLTIQITNNANHPVEEFAIGFTFAESGPSRRLFGESMVYLKLPLEHGETKSQTIHMTFTPEVHRLLTAGHIFSPFPDDYFARSSGEYWVSASVVNFLVASGRKAVDNKASGYTSFDIWPDRQPQIGHCDPSGTRWQKRRQEKKK